MMKTIVVIVLLCVFIYSCERKSGRRSSGLNHTQRGYSNNRTSTNKIIDRRIIESSDKMQKTIWSGSDIFEKYTTAVFMIYTFEGHKYLQGSGFFITSSGVAISNYHVFEGTTIGKEIIKISDGRIFKVKEVIKYSKENDYIIFKVDIGSCSMNYIPISSSKPKVGEKVYAIGSPKGLDNTFSSGEISQIRDNNLLQINVPIDHGSSGGPLINSRGEVVGITTGGFDKSGANLNFAVDIGIVQF